MALKEISYGERVFEISYELENLDKEKCIIFLHGWGSNKDIMKQAFTSVFNEYKKLYIDMPGFGKSPTDAILTTKDYAYILDILLDELSVKKYMIFGHSFGGKVGTLLNPEILCLLSSAGIPVEKPLKVKLKIALSKKLKPLLGDGIKKAFITNDAKDMPENMYETLKNVVDEDFSEYFAAFQNSAFIFWGKEDITTPLACGETIATLIKNSKFFPLNGDHYFFLLQNKKIEEILLKEHS